MLALRFRVQVLPRAVEKRGWLLSYRQMDLGTMGWLRSESRSVHRSLWYKVSRCPRGKKFVRRGYV